MHGNHGQILHQTSVWSSSHNSCLHQLAWQEETWVRGRYQAPRGCCSGCFQGTGKVLVGLPWWEMDAINVCWCLCPQEVGMTSNPTIQYRLSCDTCLLSWSWPGCPGVTKWMHASWQGGVNSVLPSLPVTASGDADVGDNNCYDKKGCF